MQNIQYSDKIPYWIDTLYTKLEKEKENKKWKTNN